MNKHLCERSLTIRGADTRRKKNETKEVSRREEAGSSGEPHPNTKDYNGVKIESKVAKNGTIQRKKLQEEGEKKSKTEE